MPLAEALLELHELAAHSGEQQIIQAGLEAAVTLTGSEIGYFHFVNEDQETIELVTWSRATLETCKATYDRHYPISGAGVWADCARHRRPFVHNDYPSLPNRSGYPEGHADLLRHLGVPVIEGQLIRVLTGVGNKRDPYDDEDIACVQRIADTVWTLVQRRREHDRLVDTFHQVQEAQELALVCTWQCDVEDDRIELDHVFTRIFGLGREAPPHSFGAFLEFFEPMSQAELREAMSAGGSDHFFSLRVVARCSKGALPLSVRGHVIPRPRGSGVIVRGIIQDISDQRAMQSIRDRALQDPLTGLGNRHRLDEYRRLREGRFRRASDGEVAVLYLDLDHFKAVNDELGHQAGDLVLQEVGRRLQRVIRKTDLIIRVGGDEFLVVQHGVQRREDAEGLAKKIQGVLHAPVLLEGRAVHVGVTAGIALSDGAADLDTLVERADQALYQGKRAGRGGLCFAEAPTRMR